MNRAWHFQGGRWIPAGSLPLDDRGFRYGMSFFETIAIREGRSLLEGAHLERLNAALISTGSTVRCGAIPPTGELPDGVLRIYATAGPGAPCDPFAGDLFALFESMEVDWSPPPARVLLSAAPFLGRPGGWKTGNYWPHIDALALAKHHGCDEALLFNPAGMLAGASMANVFLLLDGGWTTPHVDSGARPGAVRGWLMRLHGIPEEFLDAEACRSCRAALLTNSRTGVRAVGELDGRPLDTESVRAFQANYLHDVFNG